jgi:hypothetical protein
VQGHILSTSGDALRQLFVVDKRTWVFISQVSEEIHVNNTCSFLKHMKLIAQVLGISRETLPKNIDCLGVSRHHNLEAGQAWFPNRWSNQVFAFK